MRKRGLKNKRTKSFKPYLFWFVVFVIAVFFFTGFMEKNAKTKEVNKEVDILKKEIEKYEKDNKELSELIKYFSTDDYVEEQARLQLGLKKEGEKVVVVKESKEIPVQNTPKQEEILTNYQKWMRYIFGSK